MCEYSRGAHPILAGVIYPANALSASTIHSESIKKFQGMGTALRHSQPLDHKRYRAYTGVNSIPELSENFEQILLDGIPSSRLLAVHGYHARQGEA